MKPSEFIGGAADVFIIAGCVLLGVVIWAYCGTCCQSKWMLIVVMETVVCSEWRYMVHVVMIVNILNV